MIELEPLHESWVLQAAREIADDQVRGKFFKHVADRLRPLRQPRRADVKAAIFWALQRALGYHTKESA